MVSRIRYEGQTLNISNQKPERLSSTKRRESSPDKISRQVDEFAEEMRRLSTAGDQKKTVRRYEDPAEEEEKVQDYFMRQTFGARQSPPKEISKITKGSNTLPPGQHLSVDFVQ